MSRTDVHAPKNFQPEDYEFVGCGNHATAEIDGYSPHALINALVDVGYRFDDVNGSHHCSHCGSFLTYYAIMSHTPSKTLIHVGETCLDNRFDKANSQFASLRKQGKLNREGRRLSEKRDAFLSNVDNGLAYRWANQNEDRDEFAAKFVHYVRTYGEASEKFVGAILRSEQRQREFEARKALEALDANPVIEGRQTIVGAVVSAKYKEGFYGTQLKLLVKDERGFKVYGNCPSALEDEVFKAKDNGDKVKLTMVATVKVSDNDECFGFFQRPSNARVIA